MARLAFRIAAWGVGVPVGLAVTYLAAAVIGGMLTRGGAETAGPDEVDIYLRTNGVHADLVLPVAALDVDWRRRLPLNDPDVADGGFPYLAFGWGDRGFYLTTPTWADLKVTTALCALSGLDDTVMHVQAANAPEPGSRSAELRLSAAQYHHLVDFIDHSFDRDAGGAPIPIPNAHYGRHDSFFAGRGHYSAFMTCNEWTRQALAHADLRTPLWAPFDLALFHHLRA